MRITAIIVLCLACSVLYCIVLLGVQVRKLLKENMEKSLLHKFILSHTIQVTDIERNPTFNVIGLFHSTYFDL